MPEKNYVIGVNILENLTTGMYKDSRVIYREYIQNACDQIDKAEKEHLYAEGQRGCIWIYINQGERSITIKDNATGIRERDFETIMGSIADSEKKLGENKGFRGIGRLCGLAYCKELVFRTTALGEKTRSVLRCDAAKLRRINLDNLRGKKRTINEALNEIFRFSFDETADVDEHGFEVELRGINIENTDLLDRGLVQDYLSMVAPVPYSSDFRFRNMIYQHAQDKNVTLDEYCIKLDGETLTKKYTVSFPLSNKGNEDSVVDIEFKDFYDSNKQLIAWAWVGISHFKGVINRDCVMRGLRLRKENIQIGDSDTLNALFSEDRGNNYFVGEIFAVSPELIPNSQRDYFNENETRRIFEQMLRAFFKNKLYKIYHLASAVHSDLKKIDVAEKESEKFQKNLSEHLYAGNKEAENTARNELENIQKRADTALNKLTQRYKTAEDDPNTLESKVVQAIREDNQRKRRAAGSGQVGRDRISSRTTRRSARTEEPTARRVDEKLSTLSQRERDLFHQAYKAIFDCVDEETALMIYEHIEAILQ